MRFFSRIFWVGRGVVGCLLCKRFCVRFRFGFISLRFMGVGRCYCFYLLDEVIEV